MAWRPQGTGKPGDMICLCVGGRLFITRRATLYRLPDSRLYLIATQGAGSQSTTTNLAASFNFNSDFLRPTDCVPSPSPSSVTCPPAQSPNPSLLGNSTVGGATILNGSIAAMIAGNMNLKSATALTRNRGSLAPGIAAPTQVTPTQPQDFNCSMNLSVPTHLCSPTNFSVPVYQQSTPVVYFYDRDPEIFRFVLDYYRTGELHLPSSICGPFVRKELIFWGIDESLIGPCCMPAYMRYDEEKRTKNTLFRDCFEDIESMQNLVEFSRGWKKWRYRMWLFMDHPSSSLPAKIWASCLLALMIASVMCFCLSTHDNFRMQSGVLTPIQRLSKNKLPSIADRTVHGTTEFVNRYDKLTNSTSSTTADEDSDSIIGFCKDSFTSSNPKLHRDCYTEPARGLVMADIALSSLFSAEFMLKLLLAPDKRKFLSCIVSILDITILCSYWVYMSLFYFYYYRPKFSSTTNEEFENQSSGALWLMNVLFMTQVMRILRIFKISKISRILRVLILTVKKSIPELVLLGFLLMNGMFLFSSLMYTAEYYVYDTFPNIPQSFWWSIITLTAVGYGDMYPKGGAGYFVGSITAICGCIVTGLAIPIIGNNFNTYYKYMKNQQMEDKYLKALQKDMGGTLQPGKSGIGAAAEKTGLSLPGRKHRQMNRRAIRERAQGRTFKQKLVRLFHVDGNSIRNCLPNKYASRRNNWRFTNLNAPKKPTSSDDQNCLSSVNSNNISVLKPDMHMENERSPQISSRRMTNFTIDGIENEQRTSLVYPLATDNLLNSLSTTHLVLQHTPEVWLGDEDAVETPSNSAHLAFVDNGKQISNDASDQSITKLIQSSNCFQLRGGQARNLNDSTVDGTWNSFDVHERTRDTGEVTYVSPHEQSDEQLRMGKRKNYV